MKKICQRCITRKTVSGLFKNTFLWILMLAAVE